MGVRPGVDDLVAAVAFFGSQIVEISDEQWTRPTPCGDWTVRALLSHVVVQDSQVREVLGGGRPVKVVYVDESILGHHPVGTWRGTALGALEAFGVPGVLEATFPHPTGDVDGATLLGFRLVENLVHGWDVARACERDVVLDDSLATLALDFCAPLAHGLLASGHFAAAPTAVPADAAAGERLLAFCGRRV
jgi:uncharacterized protein (TIGR03086 family)